VFFGRRFHSLPCFPLFLVVAEKEGIKGREECEAISASALFCMAMKDERGTNVFTYLVVVRLGKVFPSFRSFLRPQAFCFPSFLLLFGGVLHTYIGVIEEETTQQA